MKRVFIALAVALALAGSGFAVWYHFFRGVVSTDDAYIATEKLVISPKVSGYVLSVAVKQNEAVKKGDVIAQIDPQDYDKKLAAATAAKEGAQAGLEVIHAEQDLQAKVIAEAEAAVAAAEADVKLARADLGRTKGLVGVAITKQEADTRSAKLADTLAAEEKAKAALAAARQQQDVLSAQLKKAEADVHRADADLALAQQQVDETTLRAPIDGIVGPDVVQVGQLVQPGSALAFLIPQKDLWVVANFKETDIAALKPGMTVKIAIDAYPDMPVSGTVISLSPASGSEFSILPSENATGNFTKIVQRVPVKIGFAPDTDLSLMRPGLSCVVTIDTRHQP